MRTRQKWKGLIGEIMKTIYRNNILEAANMRKKSEWNQKVKNLEESIGFAYSEWDL